MDPREKKRQQREEHRQEIKGQRDGGAKGTKKEKPKCEMLRKNDGTNDTKFSQLKTPKRREWARRKPTETSINKHEDRREDDLKEQSLEIPGQETKASSLQKFCREGRGS